MVAAVAHTATIIQGFPDQWSHLSVVPPAPSHAADPFAEHKRADWEAWGVELARYREERKRLCKDNPALQNVEKAKCALDPAYFLAVYGWIYEPRQNPEFGITPGPKQWIPFQRQVELIQWFEARMEATGADRNGVVSKSRSMGASWTLCAWFLHGWLCKETWHTLLLSRVEDLVESKNQDSLFWKIDFLIRHLPHWLLPAGFSLKDRRWNTHLSLVNPVTMAEITGESTTSEAGRSGRYSAVAIDEGAFVPDLQDVLTGVSATTFHWFVISSESRKLHSDFHRLGVGNTNPAHLRPSLFTMDYWEHPNHTSAFIEAEKATFESRGALEDFYQEYLRDTRAGGSRFVYPAAADLTTTADLDYVPMGHLYASIDPGFGDDTAIVWIEEVNGEFWVIGGYQNSGHVAEFYGTIITGEPNEKFNGEYTMADREFMAWTATLPKGYLKNRSFFGDVSGQSVDGSSYDSWYSTLEKEFKISINKDRTPEGDLIGYRKGARTHPGRIEAVRKLLPKFRFSDRHNAPFVLRCLQEYQFKPETGRSTTQPKSPIHNEFSHMATAVEYFAVHYELRFKLEAYGTRRAKQQQARNARDLSPKHGPQRLQRPSRLTGVAT